MTGRALCLWIEPKDKSYGVDMKAVFSSGGSGKCTLCKRTHELNWGYNTNIPALPWILRKGLEDIY
jgi:hypothetical protein